VANPALGLRRAKAAPTGQTRPVQASLSGGELLTRAPLGEQSRIEYLKNQIDLTDGTGNYTRETG
jgi:hypothetical protein